jgi:hypothetical protein
MPSDCSIGFRLAPYGSVRSISVTAPCETRAAEARRRGVGILVVRADADTQGVPGDTP